MIFHEHQCIFVQIPKCASTSILKAFGLDWYHPDAHLLNNASADDYSLTLPTYFRFSVVRNPFDRFVSGWKYCEFTKYRPLVDVLRNPPRSHPVPKDPRDPTTEFGAYHHIFTTQCSRLFKPDGILGLNFLMRYETLQEDFDRVCDLIGKPRCTLPHENHTERLPYQAYFGSYPEARKLVEQHFRSDLDSFGYHY